MGFHRGVRGSGVLYCVRVVVLCFFVGLGYRRIGGKGIFSLVGFLNLVLLGCFVWLFRYSGVRLDFVSWCEECREVFIF